ncbi:MAG: MMPL family transporter [Actinomycetales bacterium]|nr:MMPL family transporter [Actinomycetales bacterium]
MVQNSRRSRWITPVLAVVLLVWLGVGYLGGLAQGKLSQVTTNDQASFLPLSAESTRAAEAAEAFVEDKVLPGLVVLRGEGEITPEQLETVQEFASSLAALELEGQGDGAALRTVGDVFSADPFVVPSEDGEALLVTLSLDGAAADETLESGERASRAVVDLVRAEAESVLVASGIESWLTGPAGFVADLVAAFGAIDGVLLVVALAAVLVILVLVYRSPLIPLAVIGTAVFGLCLAGLVVYELTKAGVLVLNGQTQGILSILVVGASVDYSLLLVARYREELGAVAEPRAAMWRAIKGTFEPVTASAATVVAGLMCLLLSDLASNRSLGPVAAIGIAGAYLSALTLLPAVLLLGGRRARFWFWPRKVDAPAPGAADGERQEEVSSLWRRVAEWVTGNARKVWIASALGLAALAAFAPTLQAYGTSETDLFLTPVESVEGQEFLTEHFPAGAVQPANVIAPADRLDEVVEAASAVDGIDSVTPYTGSSFGPVDPDAEVVEVDGRVRIDVQTVAVADSLEAVDTIRELRTAVHAVDAGILVGGASAERADTQDTTTRDLRVIVPTVLAVIFLILCLLLRSILAPVLLMTANVLSFLTAMGVGALVFNHVLGFPGMDPVVPLYAFCFLIALGVDYSIFLMSRVREEAAGLGTRAGVRRGLGVTGSVITSAGLVLATTFAALGIVPLLFLAQLAFLVAFGVLVDTFIVRSLLVPALVHDIGRQSWWPGPLAKGKP